MANSRSSSKTKSAKPTTAAESSPKEKENQITFTDVLVKKILPYLALPLIPLISSSNAVMTRAAYIYVPEGKEPLDPFVLGCLRMYQAFFCFLFARWWRNEIMLKKYSAVPSTSDENVTVTVTVEEQQELELEGSVVVPISDSNGTPRLSAASRSKSGKKSSKNNSSQETTTKSTRGSSSPPKNKMHTLNEAKPSNVMEALSAEDQRRHKEQILTKPERVSPALMDILQAWILGLLTCGNVFLFTKGIQYTDGTTTAAFLATIPPSTFIIGYTLGLEKYSHSRAFATILIIAGNIIMNHLWRLVSGDFSDGKHTVMYYVGSLMLFVSCLCGAGYFVLQRPLSSRMSFLDFFVHMYGFGSAVAWVITLFPRENLVTRQLLSGLYPAAWGAIFVGGVLQCFVGFLLVAFVSNFTGSSVIVTLVRASAPVLIVGESILFLGETLDQYQIYGGMLILSGVSFALAPVFFAEGGILKSGEMQEAKDKAQQKNAGKKDDKGKRKQQGKDGHIAGDDEGEDQEGSTKKNRNEDDDDDGDDGVAAGERIGDDDEETYDSRVESIVIVDPSTILPVSMPVGKF